MLSTPQRETADHETRHPLAHRARPRAEQRAAAAARRRHPRRQHPQSRQRPRRRLASTAAPTTATTYPPGSNKDDGTVDPAEAEAIRNDLRSQNYKVVSDMFTDERLQKLATESCARSSQYDRGKQVLRRRVPGGPGRTRYGGPVGREDGWRPTQTGSFLPSSSADRYRLRNRGGEDLVGALIPGHTCTVLLRYKPR